MGAFIEKPPTMVDVGQEPSSARLGSPRAIGLEGNRYNNSPNWCVVQDINHRSVWDIIENGLSDIDLLQDNNSSNFFLFVDLCILKQINLQRSNIDVIPIVQPVNTAPWNVTKYASFLNDDYDVDANDEDDESVEEFADEENDIDTEKDNGQRLLILKKIMVRDCYHNSNSNQKIFKKT